MELAQIDYLLPRLTGRGIQLSRLGGGIGTRGPGETKLEFDRRRLRERRSRLKKQLDHVQEIRELQRKSRSEIPLPLVALIGYTNAGKTTLFNRLTGSSSFASPILFATLDPAIKSIRVPNQQTVLFSDTVGFIRKLPTELVAAFRATLEEVVQAHVLLHVIDASHETIDEQFEACPETLRRFACRQLYGLARFGPNWSAWNIIPVCFQSFRASIRGLFGGSQAGTGKEFEDLLEGT